MQALATCFWTKLSRTLAILSFNLSNTSPAICWRLSALASATAWSALAFNSWGDKFLIIPPSSTVDLLYISFLILASSAWVNSALSLDSTSLVALAFMVCSVAANVAWLAASNTIFSAPPALAIVSVTCFLIAEFTFACWSAVNVIFPTPPAAVICASTFATAVALIFSIELLSIFNFEISPLTEAIIPLACTLAFPSNCNLTLWSLIAACNPLLSISAFTSAFVLVSASTLTLAIASLFPAKTEDW